MKTGSILPSRRRYGENMLIFKECTCCKTPWYSREEFLGDSKLDFIGYQVNFSKLELGYFLFNHLVCQSTIAVPAGRFRDLYEGPIFSDRKTGSEDCPGYCLDRDALAPCSAQCECAYIREIMQILRNSPKGERQPAKRAQAGC